MFPFCSLQWKQLNYISAGLGQEAEAELFGVLQNLRYKLVKVG